MPAPANGHLAANGHPAGKKASAKSRGQLKRLKAKAKAANKAAGAPSDAGTESEPQSDVDVSGDEDAEVSTKLTIQSVASSASVMTVESFLDGVDTSDPNFSQFATVFQHFQDGPSDGLPSVDPGAAKGHVYYSDDEDEDEETMQRAKDDGMTRRERREASKLSIAELKQLVDRPEVVEYFDRDARDPRLLVMLKSYRNTVPVPTHWNAKRDYLAGRRGMEKPPYSLPREL